jgi:glycosyltransferase involved in cell wall biosynthesis
MANQLPCIASIYGAAVEIVIDGQTGFLVNPVETSALAERAVRLLKDRELCRQFGQNGFRRLKTSFSIEQFESRVTNLLDKLSA